MKPIAIVIIPELIPLFITIDMNLTRYMYFMPQNQPVRFKSRFLFGGTLFVRDIIEIDDVFITLRQKSIFNQLIESVNIPLNNIKNIGIKNTLTGTNIIVESLANRSFTGHGLSANAAKTISKTVRSFNLRTKKKIFE